MNKEKLPINFVDYQRVFQVLYSLLKSADGHTSKGCKFYATAGAFILHQHYGLNASPIFGAAAYRVCDLTNLVLYFGRVENNQFVSDQNAFHAWVECEGFVIDFMAPMFTEASREAGSTAKISRRMFQKSLALDAPSADQMMKEGDFCLSANAQLTLDMRQDFLRSDLQSDLVKVAAHYYRRPPKVLDRNYQVYDTKVNAPVRLSVNAPTLSGVW